MTMALHKSKCMTTLGLHVPLFILLLYLSTSLAYHTCYDCRRSPYPKECDRVQKCGNESVCYVEEIITDSGVVLFNLGCRSAAKCHNTIGRRSINRRNYDVAADSTGDIIICEECCNGDHCNAQGCNSEPLPPLGQRGPVCYNCHQQAAEDSCDEVKVCDVTESCFITPLAPTTTDHNDLFTTGCKQKYFCDNIGALPVIGRRALGAVHNCTGCCTGDYCNQNCSAITSSHVHPPTTTTAKPVVSTAIPSSAATVTSTAASTPSTTTTTMATTTPTTTTTMATTTTPLKPTTPPYIDQNLCHLLGYEYVEQATFRSCYKIYNRLSMDWSQSRERCKQEGGDLVVFKNMEEQAYFVEAVKKAELGLVARYWVGATDQNNASAWQWVDGSDVNKTHWHPGEPSMQAHGRDEHCVELAQFGHDMPVALNDDTCGTPTNFVCEITWNSMQSKPNLANPTYCRNSDYIYIPSIGMCYKIYDHLEKTQKDARAYCQGQQAELLMLRNVTVEHFFQNLKFYDRNEAHRYWLGAERIDHSRNEPDAFRWYNGEKLDKGLTFFYGEPNNYGGDESCLSFTFFEYTVTSNNVHFALNDDLCSKHLFFICEERCPDKSYQYFPALDLCFKIYNEHVTWSEARDRCRRDHADLLEPDSPKKLEFMEKYLNTTTQGDIQEFWIGATDDNHDGTFRWMTSSKVVPSEYWHHGEPSAPSSGEHCSALYWFSRDHRILMNDDNCDTSKMRFICQNIW